MSTGVRTWIKGDYALRLVLTPDETDPAKNIVALTIAEADEIDLEAGDVNVTVGEGEVDVDAGDADVTVGEDGVDVTVGEGGVDINAGGGVNISLP